MVKELTLGRGPKVALVDDDWYEMLTAIKWASCGRYAQAYVGDVNVQGNKYEKMHRLIIDAPKGMEVDHINGNKLDNRVSNLRVCTKSQNQCNRGAPSDGKSKYKGVCWFKITGSWKADISVNKKRTFLGYFDSEIDAAEAYNKAAIELHGEFAKTNSIYKLAGEEDE